MSEKLHILTCVSCQGKVLHYVFKSHKCVLFDQFEKQSLYYEFFNRLQIEDSTKNVKRHTCTYQNKSLKDYK